MIGVLRAGLALALLAGFYLVSWTIILGYVAYSLLVLWTTFSPAARPPPSPMPLFIVVFGAPAMVAVLRAQGVARNPNPPVGPPAARVSRKQAPGLWRTVTELAETVGTPPPTEIRLTLEANAAVSEEARYELGVRRRRLDIGLPLLAGLHADELRAVLCHELGHYARRHTRFGATVYRGSAALHAARSGIARTWRHNRVAAMYTGFQQGVISAYAWLYDLVSLAVRRHQEFEADAAAAALAGPEATASALTAVPRVAVAWEDFRTRFLEPMAERGLVPDDPLRAFAELLDDPEYATVLRSVPPAPSRTRRARLDSHPPLDDRLAALRALAGDATARDLRPGSVLLGEEGHDTVPRAARNALLRPLLAGGVGKRRQLPWEEWLRDASELQGIRALEELRGPLTLLGSPEPATVGDALEVFTVQRRVRVAAVLEEADWGTAQWGAAGSPELALDLLVGQALVTAGHADWAPDWTGPSRFDPYGEEAREARLLLEEGPDDAAAMARLRFLLVLCGVDMGLPLAEVGAAARINAPGPPRRRQPEPSSTGERRFNLGAVLTLAALGIVFFWQQFTADPRPPQLPPPNPAPPAVSPDPYDFTNPYPVAPPTLPPLTPGEPLASLPPLIDCAPNEVRVGSLCLPTAHLPTPYDPLRPIPEQSDG